MTTLVVHGTMTVAPAQTVRWWWDSWGDGGFLNAVAQGMVDASGKHNVWRIAGRPVSEVAELNPKWSLWRGRLGQFGQHRGHFMWDGADMDISREAAATHLVRYLNTLHTTAPGEALRIIAHSHGGNVVKLASASKRLLPGIYFDQAVFLACPHFEGADGRTYAYQLAPERLGVILNLYSESDTVQTQLAEKITGLPGPRPVDWIPPRSYRIDQDPGARRGYENSRIPTRDTGVKAHAAMHGSAVGYPVGRWLGGGSNFETILQKFGPRLLPVPTGDDGGWVESMGTRPLNPWMLGSLATMDLPKNRGTPTGGVNMSKQTEKFEREQNVGPERGKHASYDTALFHQSLALRPRPVNSVVTLLTTKGGSMAIVPRPLTQGLRFALLSVITVVCFGCSSIAGLNFTRTPMDPTSRTYPSVASGCKCSVAPVAPRRFERVLVIVLENQDYKDAIADDYLLDLATQGANFTNFHGLFHPSYSNYLAMVAGKTIVTHFDQQRDLKNECTIADLLVAKGLDWKNYAQGYPAKDELKAYPNHCATDHRIGKYARKHVPFMSFSPIQEDEKKCGHIVSDSQFREDLKDNTLPPYAFYTPDMDNDGHDTDLKFASKWLERFLEPLRKNQAFMTGTLIVVTFDESDDLSPEAANHIYTVFLGDMVEPKKEVPDNYNHYNVLRTIEENFGLCPLGEGDGGAKPITDVWK